MDIRGRRRNELGCVGAGRHVPAGNFSDVYQGEFGGSVYVGDQRVQLMGQTLWAADGVGLVKHLETGTENNDGQEITITETSELKSFDLQ